MRLLFVVTNKNDLARYSDRKTWNREACSRSRLEYCRHQDVLHKKVSICRKVA